MYRSFRLPATHTDDRLSIKTLPGTSHVRHVNLGQDRVEAIFIEAMERNSTYFLLALEYDLTPLSHFVPTLRRQSQSGTSSCPCGATSG